MLLTFQKALSSAETPSRVLIHAEQPRCQPLCNPAPSNTSPPIPSRLRMPGPDDIARLRLQDKNLPFEEDRDGSGGCGI